MNDSPGKTSIPIINIKPLITKEGDVQAVAIALRKACVEHGFFYIIGHSISEYLQAELETQSQAFFSQDKATKMQIKMALAGKAWRGFFPVGDELTSGKPDLKEGIYFGQELPTKHPKVQAGIPLHGANLFPANMPRFKEVVLEYFEEITQLGHYLMEGLSMSLGLESTYFSAHYTRDPLCLFRIFHYPPPIQQESDVPQWGVGEHTDYGVLTILKQDNSGGLQVKSKGQWIDAPVVSNAFVCNIGDMLDKMTGGYYKSTPHRVLNKNRKGRLSYPFFFDPNFDAAVKPVPMSNIPKQEGNEVDERWDGANVHDFQGTYGDYILGKVAKVFPDLKKKADA